MEEEDEIINYNYLDVPRFEEVIYIPEETTIIEDDTGSRNDYVRKVVFSGNIEVIRNRVFYDCPNLEEVIFKHSNVQIPQFNGSGILQNCPNLKKVSFEDFETLDKYTYETVVLLSKLCEAKHRITVELKMDELDLTPAEAKASYEEIRDYVKKKYNLSVSHLNIAQVKRQNGVIERENYNLAKNGDSKQPKCTPEKEAAITEALKHFKMIKTN